MGKKGEEGVKKAGEEHVKEGLETDTLSLASQGAWQRREVPPRLIPHSWG